MTLKPNKPQKKWKQKNPTKSRIKTLNENPPIMPELSDNSKRTPEDLFPEWKKMGATLREVHFVAEYLTNGFNASKAFRTCTTDQFKPDGLSESFFRNRGSEMLRNPRVQQLMNDYTTAWLRGKAYELEHNVMETLEALAFADISMFMNPDGTPKFKSWDEIPPKYRRCIDSMERKFYGRDANREVLNITLARRSEALKSIAAYVSILRNGPAALNQNSGNATQMTADTELLLSSVLTGGRKVDRRSPAERRADKQRREEAEQAKLEQNETIAFSGLG